MATTTSSPPPLPPINQRKRYGHDRINPLLIPYCRLMGGFKRNFRYERRRGRTVKLETLTGSIISILLRYSILSLSYFIFWSLILIIFTTHTNNLQYIQDRAKERVAGWQGRLLNVTSRRELCALCSALSRCIC
jgi:hypothetical protein